MSKPVADVSVKIVNKEGEKEWIQLGAMWRKVWDDGKESFTLSLGGSRKDSDGNYQKHTVEILVNGKKFPIGGDSKRFISFFPRGYKLVPTNPEFDNSGYEDDSDGDDLSF